MDIRKLLMEILKKGKGEALKGPYTKMYVYAIQIFCTLANESVV